MDVGQGKLPAYMKTIDRGRAKRTCSSSTSICRRRIFSMPRFILVMDEGTTSSRAILFDYSGQIVSLAQQEFPQLYPAPGLVEHDPEAIWSSQLSTAREAIH